MTAPDRRVPGTDLVVTIGLPEIYAQLRTVADGQGQLAAKLETALLGQQLFQQSQAQQIADLRHDLTDHEARLRNQEAANFITPRNMWTAIATLTGVLASIFTLIQLLSQH